MDTSQFKMVALCEHIVRDVTNKHSLIGLYSGDIVVPEFPARLRMAFYVELLPKTPGEHNIDITFYLNGSKSLEGSVQISNSVVGVPAVFFIQGLELGIDNEARLTIDAVIDREKPPTNLVNKRISKGEVPGPQVTLRPEAQSPASTPQ